MWNAKKSILPSMAVGDISDDDDSFEDERPQWLTKESIDRSLAHNFVQSEPLSPESKEFLKPMKF